MRVVRNMAYVKARRRVGRAMVALGMIVLAVSLAMLFTAPSLVIYGMVLTVLGYFFFFGGLQQVARWSRKNRNDEILDSSLSRLNDRSYTLIHYADFPGRRPDHVLITPTRLLVITAREIGGRVRVKGRSWRKSGMLVGSLFNLGGPQLGNPTLENEQQVEALREFLASESLPGDVDGAVVFVHPQVEVEVVETSVPVLHVTELFDFVRVPSEAQPLNARDRDTLIEKLSLGKEIEQGSSTAAPPKKRVRAA